MKGLTLGTCSTRCWKLERYSKTGGNHHLDGARKVENIWRVGDKIGREREERSPETEPPIDNDDIIVEPLVANTVYRRTQT